MKEKYTLLLLLLNFSPLLSQDKVPPQAKAKTDVILELGSNGEAILTPEQVDDGSSDNITSKENLQYSLNNTVFSCADLEKIEEWQLLGADGASSDNSFEPDLIISQDGTPYLSYADGAFQNKTTVKKWNGNGWEALGGEGISASGSYHPSLAISSDDTLYVAYGDQGFQNKTTVKKWDGNNWQALGGEGISTGQAYSQDLVAGPDGTLFVAYADIAADFRITVLKWNGGSWEILGEEGESNLNIGRPTLAIALDGNPILAYEDREEDKIIVKKWNGTSWEALGGEVTNGLSQTPSLAITPNGTPHVAFVDNSRQQKVAVHKYDGNDWVPINEEGIPSSLASYLSLVIAPDGTLYVSYQERIDGNKGTVKKWNGSSWELLGERVFPAGDFEPQSLAIAPDGTPYLAVEDISNNSEILVHKFYQSNRVTLTVEDEAGNKAISGTLINLQDNIMPFINEGQLFVIEENSTNVTEVGRVLAADNCSIENWTITEGNGENAFSIDGNGVVSVNKSLILDFETKLGFVLGISVTDKGNNVSSTNLTIQLENPTGIFNREPNSIQVLVYPNPTTGSIVIELEEQLKEEPLEISLFDMDGRLLLQHKGNINRGTEQVNAYLMESKVGVYLLQLKGREKLKTLKLVRK